MKTGTILITIMLPPSTSARRRSLAFFSGIRFRLHSRWIRGTSGAGDRLAGGGVGGSAWADSSPFGPAHRMSSGPVGLRSPHHLPGDFSNLDLECEESGSSCFVQDSDGG